MRDDLLRYHIIGSRNDPPGKSLEGPTDGPKELGIELDLEWPEGGEEEEGLQIS